MPKFNLKDLCLDFQDPTPLENGFVWTARLVGWDSYRLLIFEYDLIIKGKNDESIYVNTTIADDIKNANSVTQEERELAKRRLHAIASRILSARQKFDYSTPQPLPNGNLWKAYVFKSDEQGLIFYLTVLTPDGQCKDTYEAKILNPNSLTREQMQTALLQWLDNREKFSGTLNFQNETAQFGGTWSATYDYWDDLCTQHVFHMTLTAANGKTLKRPVRVSDYIKQKIEDESFARSYVRDRLQEWVETAGRFLCTVEFSTPQTLPDDATWTARLKDATYKFTVHTFTSDVMTNQHLYFHFEVDSQASGQDTIRDEITFVAPYQESELWARAQDWAGEEIVLRLRLMRLWREHLTYIQPQKFADKGTWTAYPISRFEDDLKLNVRFAIKLTLNSGEIIRKEHVLTKPQTDSKGEYQWDMIRKASQTRLTKWLKKEFL